MSALLSLTEDWWLMEDGDGHENGRSVPRRYCRWRCLRLRTKGSLSILTSSSDLHQKVKSATSASNDSRLVIRTQRPEMADSMAGLRDEHTWPTD